VVRNFDNFTSDYLIIIDNYLFILEIVAKRVFALYFDNLLLQLRGVGSNFGRSLNGFRTQLYLDTCPGA
jgi:hypothetical protein